MKIFRSKEDFTVIHEGFPRHIIANTDYEIIDTNQAFGLYIKVYEPGNTGKTIEVYLTPEQIDKYGLELNELTMKEVVDILNEVKLAPNCNIDFRGWEVTKILGVASSSVEGNSNINAHRKMSGFLINTFFSRPDTNTGKIGIGRGRRMWIENTASVTSVVMTAWLCIDLIVRHESMESFLFQNAKILNPHKTLEELAYPDKLQPAKKEEHV